MPCHLCLLNDGLGLGLGRFVFVAEGVADTETSLELELDDSVGSGEALSLASELVKMRGVTLAAGLLLLVDRGLAEAVLSGLGVLLAEEDLLACGLADSLAGVCGAGGAIWPTPSPLMTTRCPST